MKISDIATRKVIAIDENDSIAKALAKMEEYKIHQLPVTRNDSVAGMILLKHLFGRDYYPSKTLVKSYIIKVPYLDPDTDLDDSIIQIIKSGLRALPIVSDDELVGIVSETDLIKYVEFVMDIRPEKLVSNPITIGDEDNLGKAVVLMHENNVSRLPVVDYEEKLRGCLDNLSLIKFLSIPKESPKYSELTAVEKGSLKSFGVKDYVRNTFHLEEDEFSLKKIIKALQSNEEAVVTKNQKPVGIIVPKDILELLQLEQQYPVHISHLKDVDSFELSKFQDLIARFMEKFGKMFSIQRFFIYADSHKKKEDGRRQIFLRAKLLTDRKTYIAKSQGWGLKESAHMLLDNLEKQLIRNHGKHLGRAHHKIKG